MSIQPTGADAQSHSLHSPSPKSGLFKLSAELRNQIYELCLLDDRPLFISCAMKTKPNGTIVYDPEYPRGPRTPPRLCPREPGLLRVSLQIRREALAMFYGRNTFQARNTDVLKVWLYFLGSVRRSMLRNVRCGECYGGKLREHEHFHRFMANAHPTEWDSLYDWGCRSGSTSFRTSGWTLIEIERVEADLEQQLLTIPEGALRVRGHLEALEDDCIYQDGHGHLVQGVSPGYHSTDAMLWMNGAATADGMGAQEWKEYKEFRVERSAKRKLEDLMVREAEAEVEEGIHASSFLAVVS